MSEGFRVSKSLTLPPDAISWVIAIVAKRGAGKSYDAAVLAEEMVKAKVPIIVIDGMGTWWGLRVGKNGEGPGVPVVVLGGDHADIQLDPAKTRLITKAIVEANISAVIDVSTFSKSQQRRIVTDFAEELYRINRLERHIFIEEADMWAPQKPIGPEQAQCMGAIDQLVRRGGNRNLGCTLITQRSAVLNKDVLTQADCLITLRTLGPQDKKAILAWVENASDKDRTEINKWYDSLKGLRNGEAWVWHPESKPPIFQQVMFRERETFHATRKFLLTKQAATIKLMDVPEFIERFRNVFEPKPKVIDQVRIEGVTIMKKGPDPKAEITHILPPEYIPTHTPTSIPRDIARAIPRDKIPEVTPQSSDTITTQQVLPNIVLQKIKPTAQVPADLLDNPPTPLARVLVVLTNHEGRDDRWTVSRMRLQMKAHAWPWDDIEEAVAELTRWEILRKQSNNYLRFYRDRVKVVDRVIGLAVS